MSKQIAWLSGAASVVLLLGCDDWGSSECACSEPTIEAREAQTNGSVFNGTRLNGTRLNGTRLNGTRLNGTRLNGPEGSGDYIEVEKVQSSDLNGNIETTWLVGSDLHAMNHKGEVVSGAQLDSAKLKFRVAEGGHEKVKHVKVLDVEPLAPGSPVLLYDLAIQVEGEGWGSLCLDAAGEPTQAILLPDVWDQATGDRLIATGDGMTFACRDAALAKCVEWGYYPWDPALREHHQACTRMVRADYCGDGTPHTTYGTPVHVLDQVGVQNADPVQQFVIEAEWGPDGAVCLNADNMRAGPQALGCDIPACGAPFASGGLIQSGKIVVGP